MKKTFLATAVLLVLSFPLIASADPILGTASMTISGHTPTVGGTNFLGADDAAKVTWIANWGLTNNKILAQGAIWEILGVTTSANTNENAFLDSGGYYGLTTNKTAYVNQWLVAMNPAGDYSATGNGDNQDFLVKASVPEPAAMLLVGFGVTGLIGMRRRKKII